MSKMRTNPALEAFHRKGIQPRKRNLYMYGSFISLAYAVLLRAKKKIARVERFIFRPIIVSSELTLEGFKSFKLNLTKYKYVLN